MKFFSRPFSKDFIQLKKINSFFICCWSNACQKLTTDDLLLFMNALFYFH